METTLALYCQARFGFGVRQTSWLFVFVGVRAGRGAGGPARPAGPALRRAAADPRRHRPDGGGPRSAAGDAARHPRARRAARQPRPPRGRHRHAQPFDPGPAEPADATTAPRAAPSASRAPSAPSPARSGRLAGTWIFGAAGPRLAVLGRRRADARRPARSPGTCCAARRPSALHVLTRDFDYELPPESIAQHPAPRGESRLLVLDREGAERHRRVRDLPAPAAARRPPGGQRHAGDPGAPLRPRGRARARARAARRIELLLVERTASASGTPWPSRAGAPGPGTVIELRRGARPPRWSPRRRTAATACASPSRVEPHLDRLGHVPLPPYIKRAGRGRRTASATRPSTPAGPARSPPPPPACTSPRSCSPSSRAPGSRSPPVTLHVGIGTFKPVTAELVARAPHGRASATRSPEETAAALGRARGARRAGGRRGDHGGARRWSAAAGCDPGAADEVRPAGEPGMRPELFITPGFRFQVVDVLLTNFHLPRSTLLMLVSAFAGRERVLAAYREAVAARLPVLLLRRRDARRARLAESGCARRRRSGWPAPPRRSRCRC